MAIKKGLGKNPLKPIEGKGIGAYFEGEGTVQNNEMDSVKEVKISLVEPNSSQPRKRFDDEKLQELADSIKQHGIMQPITVVKEGKKYKIVAGERRWRAARKAELETVPIIIKDYTKQQVMELSLIENLQREDLNIIEEAEGYSVLINEYNMTQEQVAETVGKNRTTITNALRILQLEPYTRGLVADGALSAGHAKAILGLQDKTKQEEVANYVLEVELSVRETEAYVKIINSPASANNKDSNKKNKSAEVKRIEKRLKDILKTKVTINEKSKDKGYLKIEYYSLDEFDRILKILEK